MNIALSEHPVSIIEKSFVGLNHDPFVAAELAGFFCFVKKEDPAAFIYVAEASALKKTDNKLDN